MDLGPRHTDYDFGFDVFSDILNRSKSLDFIGFCEDLHYSVVLSKTCKFPRNLCIISQELHWD